MIFNDISPNTVTESNLWHNFYDSLSSGPKPSPTSKSVMNFDIRWQNGLVIKYQIRCSEDVVCKKCRVPHGLPRWPYNLVVWGAHGPPPTHLWWLVFSENFKHQHIIYIYNISKIMRQWYLSQGTHILSLSDQILLLTHSYPLVPTYLHQNNKHKEICTSTFTPKL